MNLMILGIKEIFFKYFINCTNKEVMIRNILKIEHFEKFKWNFENTFLIIRVINKIYD